jgi:hypothetical protein
MARMRGAVLLFLRKVLSARHHSKQAGMVGDSLPCQGYQCTFMLALLALKGLVHCKTGATC